MFSKQWWEPISHKLDMNWSTNLNLFLVKKIPLIPVIVVFLYAHRPHCYTRFNTLQLQTPTFFHMPGTVILRLASSRPLTFPILIIFSPTHFGTTTYWPFFIGYEHRILSRSRLLDYQLMGYTSSSVYQ